MADDDDMGHPDDDVDRTVSLPPGGLAPPPPADAVVATAPRSYGDSPAPRRGLGAVVIGVVVLLTALFVAACYWLVIRAEDDQGDGPSEPTTTTEAPPSTEATTTSTAPPTTQDPASLTVAVLNGTEQAGWAGENATTLEGAGYGTTATDAIASPDTTTIYIAREDLAADAAAVAALLGFPDAAVAPVPAEPLASDASDQEADVVVVLGADSIG